MIKHWPESSQPREKLLKQGAETLTDAELLAIILRTGVQGKNVVQLAQELLNQFDDLGALLACEFAELRTIKGLGPAKLAQIAAVRAIAQRSLKATLKRKLAIHNSDEVRSFLLTKMRGYENEVFACLFLNTKNQLIKYQELFQGSINSASVYPREVVKLALKHNAAAIIFAHNHPSGSHQPSRADKQITRQLKDALDLIDVIVLDHIIIGEGTFSMAERGLI